MVAPAARCASYSVDATHSPTTERAIRVGTAATETATRRKRRQYRSHAVARLVSMTNGAETIPIKTAHTVGSLLEPGASNAIGENMANNDAGTIASAPRTVKTMSNAS